MWAATCRGTLFAMSDALGTSRERLAAQVRRASTGQGMLPTVLDGVKLMRSDVDHPRSLVLYEPSVVIVAQGRKRGHVGGETFTYDANSYLVLSVPLPFECETFTADDGGPMLGVSVGVDVGVVGELLMRLDARPTSVVEATRGFHASSLDVALSDAATRLVECLAAPADAQVLGPAIVREITYRVLCGPRGDALRALVAVNGRLGNIHRALHRLHAHFERPFDVATLADDVGMSESSFHQHFRAVTHTSPLQYVKSIRLHKSRALMVEDGLTAQQAGDRVGYESASQFSREFKRFFGASPRAEAQRVRASLGLDATRAG